MYDFFKNISEKNSCTFVGACSIHPSINALYQIILNEIREIASYLVKLNEFNIKDIEAQNISIDGLSIFLINTSYNQKKYLDFLKKLHIAKERVKKIYVDYCSLNNVPCEIINTNFKYDENLTISELTKYSLNATFNNQKEINKTKLRLFELITIFAKLCAVEITKIKKLDNNFNEFDFEVLRFFALTNSYSIRNEKIKRRIYSFSDYSLKICLKLSELYQGKYGFKESAKTSNSLIDGHCVLVSGDDLDELEKLLETLEKANFEKEINVYTHGPLFLAHFYPYFKKNKFLKGHFGSGNAEYDFSVFNGSILITQNFVQKIDSLYRGEIFSNKLISFSKVIDIENKNYMPVLEASLNLEGCKQEKASNTIDVKYDKEKIKNFIDSTDASEVIVVSKIIDEKQTLDIPENKKIIEVNCQLEEDILIESINKLQEKGVKITVFLAQCNLSNLRVLLSLLNQKINLNITNCPHALINPHVFEALKEDFKVNII